MKYQEQAQFECLLAATCNALDLDLGETRKKLRQFMIGEGLLCVDGVLPDHCLWASFYKYNLIGPATAFLTQLGLACTADTVAQSAFATGLDPSSLDLSGKGILSIEVYRHLEGYLVLPGHHAISYEDGKLLDPARPHAGTFTVETMQEFYRREYKDCSITGVTIVNVTPQRKDKDNQ